MVRYAKGHKEATRRRIIETSGRRFKQDGIDGSGIATLMADAGLTNGAFYAHFASKDDLVAHVLSDQLEVQREGLGALAPGPAGLESLVRSYLSTMHRDNPADGCPTAALLDEIARCDDATKQAFTEGILVLVDEMASHARIGTPEAARVTLLGVLAAMVGTLQLSRALGDQRLADQVLDQGIRNCLTLLDVAQHQT